MEIQINSSFELLSDNEWEEYLSTKIFDGMLINIDDFKKYEKQILLYPRLDEAIKGHNNKVGDLKITYALCRHYFDKGIPDEPWYISPGKNGESIQYFPKFQKEHWMRREWFNHFSENMYLKYFSVWDGIIEILNIFYDINESIQDYRFRANVMKQLKVKDKKIYDYLQTILKDNTYKKANHFRTEFVHGFAPSTVTNGVILDTSEKEKEFSEFHNGEVKLVKKKVSAQLSFGIGEYTLVSEVMENINSFASYSGDKINEIINLMTKNGD